MRSIIIGKVERSAIDTGANAFRVNGYNVVYLRCSAKNDLFPIRKKHIMVILHFLASFSHIRSPFFPNFQHIFIQIH